MNKLAAECVFRAGAVLGEGPVWDVARQRLWWVDIERRELHSLEPASCVDCTWTFEQRIGFVVPTVCGDLIVGTQRGLMRFDPSTGPVTLVADPESHIPENRFNDAKCDPAGRLWAGTMSVSEAPGLGSFSALAGAWRTDRIL